MRSAQFWHLTERRVVAVGQPVRPIFKDQAERRYHSGTLFVQEMVWLVIG